MKIKYLFFSSLVAVSCLNSVHAEYILNGSTADLFKNGMKNCTSYYSTPNDLYDYYSCFSWEVVRTGTNFKRTCSKNVKENLKKLGCSEGFINSFTKTFAQDNLKNHIKKLEDIKKEFDNFKVKDLTASAQVSKYMNYIKDNNIEGMVEVDPEMQKEMKENKAKFMARKNSCSDVMNLKEPLSVDEPRDQDSVGWCYAYTVSDLLSHALGKKVSAVQMSGLFNDKFLSKVFAPSGEGGFAVTTLEEAQKNGVCLESELPSEDYEFSKMGGDLGSLFKLTRKLGRNYSKEIVTTRKGKDQETTSKPMYTQAQVKADMCLNYKPVISALQELFPRLSVDQISEMLLKSGVNAFTEMTKSCAAEKDPALSSLEIKREWRSSKLYPTIDEQLEKGNILGIAYNAGMLKNSDDGGFFMNHASSIVGRRFNEETMSCEYLLRNSWGTSCSGYSEDYECKNGHIWINEEAFKQKNSIFEVEYVEKK